MINLICPLYSWNSTMHVKHTFTQPVDIVFYSALGQEVSRHILLPNQTTLQTQLPIVFVYYTLSQKNQVLKSGKLICQ